MNSKRDESTRTITELRGVPVDDSFAEAFGMRYTRVIVTAIDERWAEIAGREATGYGSSIISCDAEAAIERRLAGPETPDGRPGVALLFFGFSTDALAKAVQTRVGQCILTCPTTALYSDAHLVVGDCGEDADAKVFPLGEHLRFFGDGHQKSKVIAGRRYWRVPVMDGEFLIEESASVRRGIAGGNLLFQGHDQGATLAAATRAVEALSEIPGIITPFPGGLVRSGSKVGSRYASMRASTNDEYCPTLRAAVSSRVHPDANSLYELIINGVSRDVVAAAMRSAAHAACAPADSGLVALSAGNYGGKLGKYHFHLREVLA